MCNDKCNGWLQMLDITLFARSIKCKWVKLFSNVDVRPWKHIFNFYLAKYGKAFLFKCNFQGQDIKISNIFVSEVCQAWSDFSFHLPRDYASQSVLNNSFIKIDNKLFFNKSLFDNNVHLVKDFFDDAGNPHNYTTFVSNYNLNNFPFTVFYGIIHAIPTTWRSDVPSVSNISENARLFISFDASSSPTKFVYKSLSKQNTLLPKAIAKWEETYDIIRDKWHYIFKLPFCAVEDPKLQFFQFRILHRIIGVNYY